MLENLGHVYKAETLEELAVVAGMNAEQLGTTIQKYNEAVAGASQDGRFNRARPCATGGRAVAHRAKSVLRLSVRNPLMTSTYCGLDHHSACRGHECGR